MLLPLEVLAGCATAVVALAASLFTGVGEPLLVAVLRARATIRHRLCLRRIEQLERKMQIGPYHPLALNVGLVAPERPIPAPVKNVEGSVVSHSGAYRAGLSTCSLCGASGYYTRVNGPTTSLVICPDCGGQLERRGVPALAVAGSEPKDEIAAQFDDDDCFMPW